MLFNKLMRKRKTSEEKPYTFTVTWSVDGYFNVESKGKTFGPYETRDAAWKAFLMFMRRRLNDL